MKKIFNNRKILYFFLTLTLFIVVGSAFVGGYYFAKKDDFVVQKKIKQQDKTLKELQRLVDESINKKYMELNNSKKSTFVEKNSTVQNDKIINSEAIDYKENSKKEIKEIKQVIYTHKPKLVIIMDDMSFNYQVKDLKKLNINITPSFFPPSKRHPFTSTYAKEFKHYMVHFPMQATNPNFKEEVNTLHTNSSYSFISARVKYIKKEFPQVRFVNNHTGSKFTSDYHSMMKLYKVLNKYNILFVDSRTTSKTKAPIVAKKYGDILLSRDVFLDNKPNVEYIQNQLKQAVRIAKKRGYAIAICHPHSKTFEALSKSKQILENVQVIYIDELYQLYKQHKLSKL